jgi:hypothetical protein
MAGFTFKSEYFTTPLKLVLPGIIVSMIGLFVSNYIFNNPEKIRGKNSRLAWDNLVQYEKIYSEFYDKIICQYGGTFNEEYVDDLLHIQEMTSENLKTLRDDKDIDKQMAAILNLRLDTYAKLKSTSNTFFDSIFTIRTSLTGDDSLVLDRAVQLSTKYMRTITRIYNRDTSIIKGLGAELRKKYPTFKSVDFTFSAFIDPKKLEENLTGKWMILLTNQTVIFEKNKKGTWILDSTKHSFTWTLNSTKVNISFDDESSDNIDIIKCTEGNMQFILASNNAPAQACRIREEQTPH